MGERFGPFATYRRSVDSSTLVVAVVVALRDRPASPGGAGGVGPTVRRRPHRPPVLVDRRVRRSPVASRVTENGNAKPPLPPERGRV